MGMVQNLYHNFAPYRLKMNGAVKATNTNINKILQKMNGTIEASNKNINEEVQRRWGAEEDLTFKDYQRGKFKPNYEALCCMWTVVWWGFDIFRNRWGVLPEPFNINFVNKYFL